MVLTVRGDIIDRVQAPDVSKEVEPKLQSIKDALPYGYRIETGGSIEESVKANSALVAVFPLMAVVMLAILMIRLQSFSRLALGVHNRPPPADRCDWRAAPLQPAVRLRGPARADCARRQDHPQHRTPGRSVRPRYHGTH